MDLYNRTPLNAILYKFQLILMVEIRLFWSQTKSDLITPYRS